MTRLHGPINSGIAAGGAGVATANADTVRLSGRMAAIYVKYNDSPPATTDVIIKTKGSDAPSITFLTLTNANTDGWFFPRITPDDLAGADLTTLTIREPIPFDDKVNVSIAQADNADNVDVYLLIEG